MKIFRRKMNVLVIVVIVAAMAMSWVAGASAKQNSGQPELQVAQTDPIMIVVQPEELKPVADLAAEQAAWDNDESIRGGLHLWAAYDSSGPDAWDVKAHPLVYMTSEGTEDANPAFDKDAPYFVGFHIIDGYSKEVVVSFLLKQGISGGPNNRFPHGFDVSPDGKWGYFGWGENTPEGDPLFPVAIVNMRTLKLDKIVVMDRKTGWSITGAGADFGTNSRQLHHIQSFWDWEGNPRVILQFGFGNTGGPHYILDPNDNNRVWKSITYDEIHPQGHPFVTPSPDGRYIYVSMESDLNEEAAAPAAGIAKLDLETGEVIIISGVGNHPIGITHTADGKFTYVNDAYSSRVFKIDDETNEVIGSSSAGVVGPYGIAFNWDETKLFSVGKGEGSHNSGGHLGMLDTKTFQQARTLHRMPIDLGGSASSVDHAILHPDPEVNELWVSNMNGWETIVLNLDTLEPTDWIATPNGGNTHNGCFVKYDADWNGELQSDMGGPKSKAMWDMVKAKVAEAAAKK